MAGLWCVTHWLGWHLIVIVLLIMLALFPSVGMIDLVQTVCGITGERSYWVGRGAAVFLSYLAAATLAAARGRSSNAVLRRLPSAGDFGRWW